jgi:hypothetical protein
VQRSGLGLDGDTPFALDIHRIKYLGRHFSVCQPPATLNQSVCESGFAVINMGNDGEIANMLHSAWKVN